MIRPQSLGRRDLVMSYFTLARDHPFEDRLALAGAAGFAGIGLYIGEYLRLREAGYDIARIADLVAEHDVSIAEIEVVRLGAPPEFETAAWEIANAFESRYLQVIGPYDGTVNDAARLYAGICDRAADHGLVCGLEFLPFTNIVNARDAHQIVELADRPNGGVCVDIWHHARGANDPSMIDDIPAERITGIQMSDGPSVPELGDYFNECLRSRHAPGTGAMDTVGFARRLLAKGLDLPWSLEVCNDDVWGAGDRTVSSHVNAAADGMRSVLAQALS